MNMYLSAVTTPVTDALKWVRSAQQSFYYPCYCCSITVDRKEDISKQLTVVILADSDLLSLPLESMEMLQAENVRSVARDFSLQMSYHRLCRLRVGEGMVTKMLVCVMYKKNFKNGLVRESNSGPLAPEARIIPLDQQANHDVGASKYFLIMRSILRPQRRRTQEKRKLLATNT